MVDRTKQPALGKMEVYTLPPVQELRLENGIPLTIVDRVKPGSLEESVFRLDIVFQCGQVDQDKLLQAGTTCRMLREGGKGLPSSRIAERLDYYGAWMEVSTYYLYSRVTLFSMTKYAEELLPLLASIVREATFPEREFEVVNTANKEFTRIRLAKSGTKAQRGLMKSLFGKGHICSAFAEDADYDALTVEDLRRFHALFYRSSLCHIFYSGKMTDSFHSLLDQSFGKGEWGGKDIVPVRQTPERHTSSEKRVFIPCDTAVQSSVRLGCFFTPRTEKDFLKANFFNTLFGGFFGSRLMKELREKRGYTYGISSQVVMYPYDMMLLIASETSPEHVDALIEGVYREIARLQEELVGEDELALVRNYYMGDLCRTYEEPLSNSDYYISMKFFGLPYSMQNDAAKASLSMTAEDIREYARKWLRPACFREAVSGRG